MPRSVFLIADTAGEFLRGRMIPTEMVEDLLTISRVPTAEIEQLAETLQREPGFPTRDRLAELVRECIRQESQTAAVLQALLNLRPARVEPVIRDLDEWRNAKPENAARMPDETLAAIRHRLAQLIRDYPVLNRFRKSRRLRTLTGSTVEQIEILCDIRPVFDKDRKQVEGLIPLTTLKVEYEGPDEESKVLEVLLSKEMLNDLHDKVTQAKQKLEVLRASGSVWIPHGWAESADVPGDGR